MSIRLRPYLLGPTSLLAAALLLTGCDPMQPADGQPIALPVINGDPANRSDYPYFVTVSAGGKDCGGSIIAPTWVLTAAHCVDGGTTATLTNHHQNLPYTGQVTLDPYWTGSVANSHDLALLRVPPDLTAGITPIQVGDPGDGNSYAAGTWVKIMGMGRTSTAANSGGTFRVATTVLHSDDYMDNIYNRWYWFDQWKAETMIGAGGAENTARTCKGDSGGPLVVGHGTPDQVQVGVASFTLEDTLWIDCARRQVASPS